MQALWDRTIDFAIVPQTALAKGLSFNELLREKLFAVVWRGHPLARKRSVALSDLAGAPFLLLKDGHCFRDDINTIFQRKGLTLSISFETGCFLTILNMVMAEMGISVVPEMAVETKSGCSFVPNRV